jgi:hypothetical protein
MPKTWFWFLPGILSISVNSRNLVGESVNHSVLPGKYSDGISFQLLAKVSDDYIRIAAIIN